MNIFRVPDLRSFDFFTLFGDKIEKCLFPIPTMYFYLAKISFPYSNFNSSQIAEWNGKFMDLDFKNKTFEPVGCDVDKFNWCTSMHPMSPLFFYGCFVVAIGFAFACINVELNTLFSKIIGPRKQGMEQGLLQVTGGSARMTGPVLIRCFEI